MRTKFLNTYYSFPVQLLLLHFRKYQLLLVFWFLLYSTISGGFMKSFGADALFFAPEYLGTNNVLGYIITGFAWGIFLMSWNITTFILHSRRFVFLATTTHPFLKYCINNSLLPLCIFIFYFVKVYRFNADKELMVMGAALSVTVALILGFVLCLLFSFGYFFSAGKSIERNIAGIINNPELFNKNYGPKQLRVDNLVFKVKYYLNGSLGINKVRGVSHYREDFIDSIFKRHHLSAIASILLAFIFLSTIGFFLDYRVFELPAAASILILFSLMVGAIGALSYFLQSWSLPFAIVLLLAVNLLFKLGVIDPRNKAYGLNYSNGPERPAYNMAALQAMCTPQKIADDKQNMLEILERWKAKQSSSKPLMVFINVSGGGLRSAVFTMHCLQELDKLTAGNLMKQTFLMTGASGGMLAATYYRELCRKSIAEPLLNRNDKKYVEAISGDLLNPVFTSLTARDILAPSQKFKVGNFLYVKDRGYAFEKKLIYNTQGLLQLPLAATAADEKMAKIPLLFLMQW